MPDFKTLANSFVSSLTPYQPGKPIEELERELGIKSSIKLASNENPLGASANAIKAAQEQLNQAHIYPDGNSYELKQAISNFLKVDSNQLIIGNGSENVLEIIIKSYLHKDDSAIISEYAFLTIPILLQSYGINIKVAKATAYGHDVKNMIAAIDARTRVIFLVNPNNPTGTYTSKNDFEYLMANVPEHVIVVVDEAYSEYIYKEDYSTALKYLDKYPNLIVVRTFSKAYGLAALRIGYSISSPEIADILNRSRLPFNVNSIAAHAACHALADQEHVRKTVNLNTDGMRSFETQLKQLQLDYIPSLANFVTINVGDGPAIYQQLLLLGIIVRPLKAYNLPAHIRVSIGIPEHNNRFFEGIAKVCQSILVT